MKVLANNGNYIEKDKCKKIGVNYYEIIDLKNQKGKGIVEIDGKYIHTEDLYFDSQTKQWSKPGPFGLDKGVISLNPLTLGTINKDPFKNCYIIYKGSKYLYPDYSKLSDAYNFCPVKNAYTRGNIGLVSEGKKGVYDYFNTDHYGAAHNPEYNKFKKNIQIPEIDTPFNKYLEDITFGVEIETSGGCLPEHFCYENGLTPVKDGSISGYEYITVPIKGGAGILYMKDILEAAAQCTKVDEFCSLHIHFGNIPDSKEFINAIYFLCYRLQHEIQELFPPFKKSTEYFAQKRNKDHCEFLPRLGINEDLTENDIFNKIITMLNEGRDLDHNGEPLDYKSGSFVRHFREGQNKWNYKKRYFWVNFMHMIFSKQKTVEFRFHSGTVNKHKFLSWLLICLGIIIFARDNPKKALSYKNKISLYEILEIYKEDDFLFNYLLGYINNRKDYYTQLSIEGSIYGDEFDFDNFFEYKYKNQNLYEWQEKQAEGS